MAATFDASIIAHPAVMLRPHPLMYSTRGFIRFFRIEKVVDERTQQLVAYRVVGGWNFAPRTIWLDGRPHPPEYAEHQYNGFSSGWGEDYVPRFPLGTRHTEFADLIGIPYEEVALEGRRTPIRNSARG